jgi:hypothetical protein
VAANGRTREGHVIGPNGDVLTMDSLPSPNTERWVSRRKAELVAAVRGELLSLEDVCARYGISSEEFLAWQNAIDRFGMAGLQATNSRIVRHQVSALTSAPPSGAGTDASDSSVGGTIRQKNS